MREQGKKIEREKERERKSERAKKNESKESMDLTSPPRSLTVVMKEVWSAK